MKELIRSIVDDHKRVVDKMVNENIEEIQNLCDRVLGCLKKGGKILFVGNGGSAADCQHLAAEFVGRFRDDRVPLAAIALTTDSSNLTSIGNDYGFEHIFSRQVAALCTAKDIVFVISTSGNSANIILAAQEARRKKGIVVGLLGRSGGRLLPLMDTAVVVNSTETARIQECHILIGHILCLICDEYFNTHSKESQ